MKILFFFFFLALGIQAFTQQSDVPAASSGELNFYIDFAAFKGKEGKTFQEFYVMIFIDQLNIEKKSALFELNLAISSANKKEIIKRDWQTEAELNFDSAGLKSLAVYDQWPEELIPGKYEVTFSISDKTHDQWGEVSFNLMVPAFDQKEIAFSQIEFVSRVESSNSNSHFLKGEKSVIPNPSRRYGLLNPVLSFYYELYNLDVETELEIDYSIKNSEGKVVKKLESNKINPANESISIIHGINVSNLPTGIYELTAELNNASDGKKIFSSRKFEIIQYDFASMQSAISEEEAEHAGRIIKYIGTPAQYNHYEKLSLTGKAQFLINFWKEFDPSPASPGNEFFQKVMERYHYANKNFGWANIEGWNTDRGRVIIKYGFPDDVQQFHSQGGTRPHEIWVYEQDKSYIFVFMDARNDGHFILIHSDKEGELPNYRWRELVQRI
jgi:GWxTD domain-containing protein